MTAWGENAESDAEGANNSESLRQKDSCRTHLWRVH